jgi:hypothetical protein
MAVQHSFSPFIENEAPHGERYRMVYEKDACFDPVAFATCGVGSVLYWAYTRPVVDGPIPFSGTFPPALPTAALTATELYAAATGFPITAHQTNMGTSSYAMFGVSQLNTAGLGTEIALPAGIVIINNVGAMSYGYPVAYDALITGLRVVRTRGVVQALVDGTTDVAPGDFLEGVNGAYNLVLDAANANLSTFKCLETYIANAVAMVWVECVHVSH